MKWPDKALIGKRVMLKQKESNTEFGRISGFTKNGTYACIYVDDRKETGQYPKGSFEKGIIKVIT